MSQERQPFFKGVKFEDLVSGVNEDSSTDNYRTDSQIPADNPLIVDLVTGKHRFEKPLWVQEDMIADFLGVLRQIREMGIRVPVIGRNIAFVNKADLIPEDPFEQYELFKVYGKDFLEHMIGKNVRLGEGRYLSSVGYLGQEHAALPIDVMSVMAHEHAHTLGRDLPNLWEEMKATAFEAHFMAVYLGVNNFTIDGDDPDSLHDIASNRNVQLNNLGIHNLEIVSHLSNETLGRFGPNDYARHVGARGRLMGRLTRHSH